MNTLTVNLHLLMATFYRPTRRAQPHRHRGRGLPLRLARRRLAGASPRLRPGDRGRAAAPARGRGRAAHRGHRRPSSSDMRGSVALVLLGGVNYLTGELLDIRAVTAAGHDMRRRRRLGSRARGRQRAARAAARGTSTGPRGATTSTSTPGPGGPGGAFVHARHGHDASLPRLAGWWGNDPATRFRMEPGFVPRGGRGRLAGLDAAGARVRAAARLARALRRRRHAGAARALAPPHGLPRVAARRRRRRAPRAGR